MFFPLPNMWVLNKTIALMHLSICNFNIPSPQAPTQAFEFFLFSAVKFPSPGSKTLFKCPMCKTCWMGKCPTTGHFNWNIPLEILWELWLFPQDFCLQLLPFGRHTFHFDHELFCTLAVDDTFLLLVLASENIVMYFLFDEGQAKISNLSWNVVFYVFLAWEKGTTL